MTSRTVSLKAVFLPIVFESAARKAEQRVVKLPLEKRAASAQVATRHLDLSPPEACCDHGSLYSMWTKLKPYPLEIQIGSNQLRSEWFAIYFLLVAWFAVVAAGLGSEIVLGRVIMDGILNFENGFVAWHFSQLVFSLLLTVAFTASDGIGLFFLPFGLWKMGSPRPSRA